MDIQSLKDQILGLKFLSCEENKNHLQNVTNYICRKSSCENFLNVLCPDCTFQSAQHKNHQETDFTNLKRLLQEMHDIIQGIDQKNENLEVFDHISKEFQILSSEFMEISQLVLQKKQRLLDIQSKQNMHNYLQNIVYNTDNIKYLNYSIQNLVERYFVFNKEGQIQLKYNKQFFEQISMKINNNASYLLTKYKNQLEKLKEYFQENELQDKIVTYLKWERGSDRASQQIIVDNEDNEMQQLFQGTRIFDQSILSESVSPEGIFATEIQIKQIGEVKGRVRVGVTQVQNISSFSFSSSPYVLVLDDENQTPLHDSVSKVKGEQHIKENLKENEVIKLVLNFETGKFILSNQEDTIEYQSNIDKKDTRFFINWVDSRAKLQVA